MARHVVAQLADIPPGSRKLVEAGGRPIVIFNVGGELFAVSNRCPHAGGSLLHSGQRGLTVATTPGEYSYSRSGEIIKCPWHGWEFDLRTGQSWCDPSTVRVKNYAVSVEPGCRVAEGPYKAEMFTISVENDYVLIEL